jgi:hypothetical protein
MEPSYDDRFVVFLRHPSRSNCPDCAEQPLVICSSYAEARRIQREFHFTARDCVIRFVGQAGGGD